MHTGYLDPYRPPTKHELETLPLFDKRAGSDYGRACLYGTDENGHQVWVVGRLGHKHAPRTVLVTMAELFPAGCAQLVVDVAHLLNWQMRCGGFLSRALRLSTIGYPLLVSGTHHIYDDIVALVAHTRRELESFDNRVRA